MYLIFSPIFYINGDPHVGHKFTIQIINCIHRLISVCGVYSLKYSGTDEHGDKIINTLEKLQQQDPKVTYETFLSNMRAKFANVYPGFNVYHTNDEHHRLYIKSVYKYLKRMGIIYEGVYKGYYCLREEKYLGQDELTDERLKDKNVVQREEKGLFMKIDKALNDDFIKHITSIIYNKHYHNEAINILNNTQDIFISRNIRHDALIPVDDFDDLSFYVWFDAINYYNCILSLYAKYNVSNIIVIGCDIMRFHLIMLLHISYYLYQGLLPFRFFIHGMITQDGTKVSKSLNNFKDINELADKYKEFFFSSLIANGLNGEIIAGEDKCQSYITNIKNNVRNLYNRMISINALYSEYNNIPLSMLSININSPNINKIHKILQDIKNTMLDLELVNLYQSMNELANLGNTIINTFELWKVAEAKVALLLECKVIMYYLIIVEYILGHDVDNLIKKTNIETYCSLFYIYPQNFSIDNLKPEDVII